MKRYRFFKAGVPHHVYIKAENSFILFYTQEDVILYYTLYSCLARKYGIRTLSLCIMPNHIHSVEIAPDKKSFLKFHAHLGSIFTKEYNLRHNRKGKLLASPFGYAPKSVTKRIRDTVCYVANNPVAGGLSDSIVKYRWNLLAYNISPYPFSEKLILREASHRFRCAVRLLDCWLSSGRHLSYARQKAIFLRLDHKERNQIVDRIISKYNILDYKALCALYKGSYQEVLSIMDLGKGNEFDLEDDFDNYSSYHEMIRLLSCQGFDLQQYDFGSADREDISRLYSFLRGQGFKETQIRKLLHLKE